MRSNQLGIVPIILVVVVVIVIVGAYVLGGKNSNLSSIVNIGSPSPIATTDPTVGWKTYSDVSEKFTFKYPNDWLLTPGQVIELSYNKTNLEISYSNFGKGELADFLDERIADYKLSSFVADPVLKSESSYKIGDLDTQEIQMQQTSDSMVVHELYASPNNNNTIGVTVYHGESSQDQVNHILSSFKFTN